MVLFHVAVLCGRCVVPQSHRHPRFKRELGRRLAVALHRNLSGPVLAGCSLNRTAKSLNIRWRADRLGGEQVVVTSGSEEATKASTVNRSAIAGSDSSHLYLLRPKLVFSDICQ